MIAGYYGAGNTGDEAILAGMIRSLRARGIDGITVLSRDPALTREMHGVRSIYIGRRHHGLGAVFRALRGTRLLILGGGGLLQDAAGRVVPYWLTRVALALAARTPVMYYAQGIGPLRTAAARRLVRFFSNRVTRITVRDEESRRLLREIGVVRPPVEVTADPALGMEAADDGAALLRRGGVGFDSRKITLGVSLRPWPGETVYRPVLVGALKNLKARFDVRYVFFPFQYGADEEACQRVKDAIGAREDRLLTGVYSPAQMAAMLREMDGVIGMRLHAVILSALVRVPVFGLVYDPKVRLFLERTGNAECGVELAGVRGEHLNERLAVWLRSRKQVRDRMAAPVARMIGLAERNAEIARAVMVGPK